MITKGKRLGGQPSKIISGEASTLERIPLEEKVFNEDWIQELIFKNPSWIIPCLLLFNWLLDQKK
jgi:hypothetical protein